MRFVQCSGTNGDTFVDLEKVIAVTCIVKVTGGMVDIVKAMKGDSTASPVVRSPVITLSTAAGEFDIIQPDFDHAEMWLKLNLGIEATFDRDGTAKP